MDLIRELMLTLEAIDTEPNRIVRLDPSTVEGYEPKQVIYHYRLLCEAGYVDVGTSTLKADLPTFRRLTWAGHDFIDSVRDPEVWRKTKAGASKAGSWTIEI